MDKIKIREAIVVEGRYDRNTLSQIVSADIIVTNGFGIFSDEGQRRYIADTAREKGIVIFTDSDSAGFSIRKEIRSFVDGSLIKDAYLPVVHGKEKRKRVPGKEGILGVEGADRDTIIKSLSDSGAVFENDETASLKYGSEVRKITSYDLFRTGVSGGKDSSKLRSAVLEKMVLPKYLSVKDLLSVLNRRYSPDEFEKLVSELKGEEK